MRFTYHPVTTVSFGTRSAKEGRRQRHRGQRLDVLTTAVWLALIRASAANVEANAAAVASARMMPAPEIETSRPIATTTAVPPIDNTRAAA